MKMWLARQPRDRHRPGNYLLSTSRLKWSEHWKEWCLQGAGTIIHCSSSWWHRRDPDKKLRLKSGEGPVEVTIERLHNETSN